MSKNWEKYRITKQKLTCMIPEEADEALRAVCYHEKKSMSEVVAEAILEYVARAEKKNGVMYTRRGDLGKK